MGKIQECKGFFSPPFSIGCVILICTSHFCISQDHTIKVKGMILFIYFLSVTFYLNKYTAETKKTKTLVTNFLKTLTKKTRGEFSRIWKVRAFLLPNCTSCKPGVSFTVTYVCRSLKLAALYVLKSLTEGGEKTSGSLHRVHGHTEK